MVILPEFTKEQWLEYLERLTLHSVGKFRYLGWTASQGDRTGPKGMGPQDIASEAIAKVLAGDRQYDCIVYPDFMDFLKSIADSLISHLVDSFERKRFKPMPENITEHGDCTEVEFESKEATPEIMCVDKETAEKIKTILLQEFKDDPVVKGILDCFESNITKPAEIAEVLEVNVKEIYNARKRIQGIIDKKALMEYQK